MHLNRGDHYGAKNPTYEAPVHLAAAKAARDAKAKKARAAARRKGSDEPWNDPQWRAALLKKAYLAYARAHRQAFGRGSAPEQALRKLRSALGKHD